MSPVKVWGLKVLKSQVPESGQLYLVLHRRKGMGHGDKHAHLGQLMANQCTDHQTTALQGKV